MVCIYLKFIKKCKSLDTVLHGLPVTGLTAVRINIEIENLLGSVCGGSGYAGIPAQMNSCYCGVRMRCTE